jgi:hypothetical protein
VVEAFASSRMMLAASWSCAAGVVTVGLLGQRIATTVGCTSGSADSTSSMMSWSWPLRLPLDAGWWGAEMMGTRCLLGHRGPGSGEIANQGRLFECVGARLSGTYLAMHQ